MILLDTNIISELIKPHPNPEVAIWIGKQPAAELFITAITEAELHFGLALLPESRRRDRLYAAVTAMLAEDFAERILPFDSLAATAYAAIANLRHQAGRPIAQFDAQIAAIAKSRGASLATRNAMDFDGCGIDVINPWGK